MYTEVVYGKKGVGKLHGLRQLTAEQTQICYTLPPPMQFSYSHLSEIHVIATKLVFSAGWNPGLWLALL